MADDAEIEWIIAREAYKTLFEELGAGAWVALKRGAAAGGFRAQAEPLSLGGKVIDVPPYYWSAEEGHYRFDAPSGSFSGRAFDPAIRKSVQFDLNRVRFDRGALLDYFNLMVDRVPARAEAETAVRSGRGRKPKHYWPKVCVAVALVIERDGVKPGSGAEGQGELVDAILTTMTQTLKLSDNDIPDRTTIVDIAQEILNRVRGIES